MPPDGRRPRLQVTVSDERGHRVPGRLAQWLARAAPARARGAVHVALVSDARVRRLNREYRGQDAATDVLSFAYHDQSPRTRTSVRAVRSTVIRCLGDIVIARGVARRQARSAGHAEATEWRVLALHGLLHLLGYDHETDRGEMARAERRLRHKAGLRDGLIDRAGSARP